MKALKYIFILLLVIVIAGAIYFSLQESHFKVEKSQVVEAPINLVYDQIANFKNWEDWNEHQMAKGTEVDYSDQTAGVDAYYKFKNDDGDGKMTITRLDPNKLIEIKYDYPYPTGNSTAQITYNLREVENGTLVEIDVEGDKRLTQKIMESLGGENKELKLASMYDLSLPRLETKIVQNMEEFTISPDGLIDYGGGYYLYISSSTRMDNLNKLQNQMLRKIRSFMTSNDIDAYGAPMIIYEKFDENRENVIFSAGIPVKDRIITAVNSTILCGFQEPGRAVKVTLKGNYKYLPDAWQIAEGFITVNGLSRSQLPPFEFYKTDPLKTPNPANYLTELYIPVE